MNEMKGKTIAVMQPYIFPYIGYFQLIHCADEFIFYDDVNFIKRGWINRNKILVNGEEYLFSIPLKKASQNKLINDIETTIDEKFTNKFLTQIQHAYSRAPRYNDIYPLIKTILLSSGKTIADLAINSIDTITTYLDIPVTYKRSSEFAPETHGQEKADRLINITKKAGGKNYVNVPGGKILYDKAYFKEQDINLYFIESKTIEYNQFNNEFIPWLSIIDILMFNNKEQVKEMMENYKLT